MNMTKEDLLLWVQQHPEIVLTCIAAILSITVLLLVLRLRRSQGASGTSPGTRRLGLGSFFRKHSGFDAETREELRETLLQADFGPKMADQIIDRLQKLVAADVGPDILQEKLRDAIADLLRPYQGSPVDLAVGQVLVLVGINGSGKTTTVAKLAQRYLDRGDQVVLGAADTFRAAAAEQLQAWGDRLDIRVVRQAAGADPAAVAFDTVKAAEKGGQTVIIDTAGRIHGDQGLMNELAKVVRVVAKARQNAPDQIWLTLDAGQGLTVIEQAKKFKEAVPVTGLIVNKLDGEGRAGYLPAIAAELDLPVIAVGVGEGLGDLEDFDPVRFADRVVYGEAGD